MKKPFLTLSITVLLAAGCNTVTAPINNSLVASPTPTAVQPTQTAQPTPPATQTSNILATINQSGSTNALGYTIAIYTDGSVIVMVQGSVKNQNFGPNTTDSKTLSELLAEIGDVSILTVKPCAKSASFGTVTTISYNGKTSPDLQCLKTDTSPSPAATNLAAFVSALEGQLKVNTSRNQTGL